MGRGLGNDQLGRMSTKRTTTTTGKSNRPNQFNVNTAAPPPAKVAPRLPKAAAAPPSDTPNEAQQHYEALLSGSKELERWNSDRIVLETRLWVEQASHLPPLPPKTSHSPTLRTLSKSYALLPLPIPSSTSCTADPLPSFYEATQELEDRVVRLELESEGAERDLEGEKERMARVERERTVESTKWEEIPTPSISLTSAQKSLSLLSSKSSEYVSRISLLNKSPPPSLSELKDRLKELELLLQEIRRTEDCKADMERQIKNYGGLPSERKAAEEVVKAKRESVAALKKERNRLLRERR